MGIAAICKHCLAAQMLFTVEFLVNLRETDLLKIYARSLVVFRGHSGRIKEKVWRIA